MDPIPMPAPYGGMNQLVPVIALQSPECENLLNFNATEQGVILRNGNSKFKTITAASRYLQTFAAYGDSKLFAAFNNALLAAARYEVYNVATGALVATAAEITPPTTNLLLITSTVFNKYLFVFTNDGGTVHLAYDATAGTWGAGGYTGTGLVPVAGDVYKNRQYIIQYEDSSYWYSGLNAISGALTKVDLSSVISEAAMLYAITPVTLADNVSAEILQAFVFSSGEVLFYAGSYPNAADWRLVGRASMGRPFYYTSKIEYQGDCLILCRNAIVSLRDLFLKGSQAALGLNVNSKIKKSWQSKVADADQSSVTGVYDKTNDRIVISVTKVGTDNNYFFIFNNQLQSWYLHNTSPFESSGLTVGPIVAYSNSIFFGMSGLPVGGVSVIWKKEGSSNFYDRNYTDTANVGYGYEVLSAPLANGRAYVQKSEGMDVILKSDLYAETSYYFIRDFGVLTTAAQLIPDQGVTLQKPFINMGIEGSYIQYKISGTTPTTAKTVGLQLYGTNIWLEQGNSPR